MNLYRGTQRFEARGNGAFITPHPPPPWKMAPMTPLANGAYWYPLSSGLPTALVLWGQGKGMREDKGGALVEASANLVWEKG